MVVRLLKIDWAAPCDVCEVAVAVIDALGLDITDPRLYDVRNVLHDWARELFAEDYNHVPCKTVGESA